LLLDTNVLIPALGPKFSELPRNIRDVMRDPDHQFMVSVASLWEIAIKARLGKLALPVQLAEVPEVLADIAIAILPISVLHAFREPLPPLDTKDPFDRLLIAICAAEQMQLVTRDEALLAHPLAWRPASA
jgi:PIN domain nuclease of toxin-antitoxin system